MTAEGVQAKKWGSAVSFVGIGFTGFVASAAVIAMVLISLSFAPTGHADGFQLVEAPQAPVIVEGDFSAALKRVLSISPSLAELKKEENRLLASNIGLARTMSRIFAFYSNLKRQDPTPDNLGLVATTEKILLRYQGYYNDNLQRLQAIYASTSAFVSNESLTAYLASQGYGQYEWPKSWDVGSVKPAVLRVALVQGDEAAAVLEWVEEGSGWPGRVVSAKPLLAFDRSGLILFPNSRLASAAWPMRSIQL